MLLNLKLIFFLISIPCILSFNIDGSGYKKLTPTPVKGTAPTNHVSFYGQDIKLKRESSNENWIEIGSPKSSRSPNTPTANNNSYTDSGDIFRCNTNDIFQSSVQTCQVITPSMKRKGDNFGLSLINSPYPEKKIAVTVNRRFSCRRNSRDNQPGFFYTSNNNGNTWDKLLSDPVVSKTDCYTRGMVDLVFVLDGSGSIRPKQFTQMLEWIQRVVGGLVETIGDRLRIAIIQFALQAKVELELSTFTMDFNITDIQRLRIRDRTWYSSGLKTALALLTKGKPVKCKYQNIMIFLSDGQNESGQLVLQTPLKALRDKAKPFTSFAVGVGKDVGMFADELEFIANNDRKNVFNVGDFTSLDTIVEHLQSNITATLEGAEPGNEGNQFSFAQFGFSSSIIDQVSIIYNKKMCGSLPRHQCF